MCCGDNICAMIKDLIAKAGQGKKSIEAEQDMILLGFAIDHIRYACPPLTCDEQANIELFIKRI